MRKPNAKNKYNLNPKDIQHAIVLDESKLHKPPFWRNNVIGAWCISETTCKTNDYFMYGDYNEYWIGFYDQDAKAYTGKIRLNCSAYGGMSNYKFNSFFKSKDIEHEIDLEIQEKLLTRINRLIDEGIIAIPQK